MMVVVAERRGSGEALDDGAVRPVAAIAALDQVGEAAAHFFEVTLQQDEVIGALHDVARGLPRA